MKRAASILLAVLVCIMAGGCQTKTDGGEPSNQDGQSLEILAEKTAVTFADVGWDSILFHNAVAGTIAEKVFGYSWSEISGSTPITHEAVIKGEIDVHMEVWSDNLPNYKGDISSGKLTELSTNFDDNVQGFYVPLYVIEGDASRGISPLTPDLKHVRDLELYANIFVDDDDPQKGAIYGGTLGWEITEIMEKKVHHYGLDKIYNYIVPGTDSAMNATLVSAYDKGKPIVAYYWEPTWLLGKYDFVLLEDEPYTDEDSYFNGETECPSIPVMVCVSNSFAKSNPEFCEFLSKYRTSSALTGEALAYIQDTDCDYREAARWFLEQHPELVDAWLTSEQAEKLRKAL